MLLLILLLLEAQDEGSQRERAIAFSINSTQWAQLLHWRAQVCEWSEMSISMNQLIRLSIIHQGSGEEQASLAPIRISEPRRRGPAHDPSKKLTVTMSQSIESKLQDLCDRSGGTRSQVMFNCITLLMAQLESERAFQVTKPPTRAKRPTKKPA